MAKITSSWTERFWSKVEKTKDGCSLWTGAVSNNGYGAAYVPGRGMDKAHRVAWELTSGPIPKGLLVCHRCDVKHPVGDTSYRRCIEPEHLFLGTARDNTQDMYAKGRAAVGDRNGSRLHPERLPHGERNWASQHRDILSARAKKWAENNPDRVARGERSIAAKFPERICRGERHYNTHFTEQDVRDIRQACSAPCSPKELLARRKELAAKYHTTSNNIWQVAAGKTWKHVK